MKRKFYSKSKVMLSLLLVVSLLITTSTSVFAIKTPEGNDFIKDTPLAGNYIESEIAANVYSEDFELGTTDGWNIYGGSWAAERSEFTTASDSPSKAIVEGANFTNFIYQSQIIVYYDYSKNSDSGIIFRVKNPEVGLNMYDGYYAGIDNSQKEVVLGKASSITGEMTIIKSVPIRKYEDYAYYLKVRADGNNIKVYLDDELYIDVYDDSYSSGSIGVSICKSGSSIDDLIAYELTEETAENEGELSGKYNNYIKHFYDNTKKWYTSQVKNNIPFEPKRGVQLNDETLINFTKELTKDIDNDYEKAKAIYEWVTTNIYYDCTRPVYEAYFDAKDVFEYKYAVCGGYSNLLASLMNIAGIPCVVVGGKTNYDKKGNYYDNPHSWNEAYVDGRWVIMDSTWDTYNKYDGEFHARTKWNFHYFDPTLEEFSLDHKIETYYK